MNEIVKGKYSTLKNEKELKNNLRKHCIPENISEMSIDDYPEFLEQRRKLMAQKMKKHYWGL